MRIRYYIDPVTGLPHIYDHNVSEQEVEVFSAGRCRIYADGMILELRSDGLKRDDT